MDKRVLVLIGSLMSIGTVRGVVHTCDVARTCEIDKRIDSKLEEMEESIKRDLKSSIKKEINSSLCCLKNQIASLRNRASSAPCQTVYYQSSPATPVQNGYSPQLIQKSLFAGQGGLLSKTLVLDKPGNYLFAENIEFNPQGNDTPAIKIGSDNVTVDLNGLVLSQANQTGKAGSLASTSAPRCIGIVIETGKNNVTILGSHGSIQNFTQLGIQVQGGSQNIQIGGDTPLTIKYCGADSPQPLLKDDLGGYYYEGGIQIGESNFLAALKYPKYNGIVQGLRIQNLMVENNTLGLWMGNVLNGTVKQCSFSYNTGTRVPGYQIVERDVDLFSAGLVSLVNKDLGDSGPSNVSFEGCSFNGNEATLADLYKIVVAQGLYINNVHSDLVFRSCSFNENKASSPYDTLNEVAGCYVGGGQGTLFEDCGFYGNSGGTLSAGFRQGGKLSGPATGTFTFNPGHSVTLRQCVSSNNLCANSTGRMKTVAGFMFESTRGLTIRDCVAESNTAITQKDPKAQGLATGVLFLSKMDQNSVLHKMANVEVRGFHASNNFTNCQGAQSISAGILACYSPGMENISVRDSVITDNSCKENSTLSRKDVGIYLRGDVGVECYPLFSIERCMISNHTYSGVFVSQFSKTIVLDNTIVENGMGIVIDKSPICTILRNSFLHNDFEAVRDMTPTCTSLVAQNSSFSLRVPRYSVFEVSYLAPKGPIPVRQGNLTANFPQGAQVYDNIEIFQSVTPVFDKKPSALKEAILSHRVKEKLLKAQKEEPKVSVPEVATKESPSASQESLPVTYEPTIAPSDDLSKKVSEQTEGTSLGVPAVGSVDLN